MQAGLTNKRLSFREIFSSAIYNLGLRNITFLSFSSGLLVRVDNSHLSKAA